MIQEFDFNAIEQPTLKITLRDKKRTVLHLIVPSEELIERFFSMAQNAKALFESKDKQTVDKLYELIAEILSSNEENISINSENIWKKYRISVSDMIPFINRYLQFVKDITEAKN